MELIRGKTFIISYAQNSAEKVPPVGCKDKKKTEGQKNPPQCNIKKNVMGTQRMSNSICTKVTVDNTRCPKPVKKSKTYDCVTRHHKCDTTSGVRGRLPSSISSPGLIEDPSGKRNDLQTNGPSTCKQNIIDYRNFVPHIPFVPSVAKSLPKKRISLRRSKQSIRNMFNLKRNKQQDTISEDESLQIVNVEPNKEKVVQTQCLSNVSEMLSDELLAPEFPDREMCIDAIDSFKALCDDVASLKSFDSLTGCGEIFADECSSFIDIENCRVRFISKPSPVAENFQGGGERLASPAKSESIDFSKLHGHVKSLPRNVSSVGLFEAQPDSNNVVRMEINSTMSRDQVSSSSYDDLMSSSENNNDSESPKSTSDEGYYDSYSPGLEEDKSELETRRALPRDSYSGDALYELFCDPEETKKCPSQECELLPSGHDAETPTSIYSFCVGSEENMAPQPPQDLEGDGVLQNTWKGRECLLKLCDTELTLSMGMVNWLKKTGRITNSEIDDQYLTPDVTQSMPAGLKIENDTVQTIAARDTDRECYKYQRGYKGNEYSSIINRIRDSENILADILSDNTSKEPGVILTDSKTPSLSEKDSPSEEILDIKDSILGSSTSTTFKDNENQEELHVTSPESGNVVPMVSLCKQDVAAFQSRLDPLHSLGLQHLSSSTSENNKCLTEVLDKLTARLSSLHITFGGQNTVHGPSKIKRPYEIAQNFRNLLEQHEIQPQPFLVQPALSSKCDVDNEKKDLTTIAGQPITNTLLIKNSKNECTTSSPKPKETQSGKVATKANFLPLFKGPCSSVISRFSSTLYKVHKPGNTVIYFNTGKFNQTPACNEDFPHDSEGLSIDFPEFRKDEFEPIGLIPESEERGLL